MKYEKTIVTHNSNFHADDAFAVAMLTKLFPDHKVIRTRDEAVIAKGRFVVDVGNVYDVTTNRFDHHQKGGAGKRVCGSPYASAGLVWKQFGPAFVEATLGKDKVNELTTSQQRELVDKIDSTLIRELDARDNGISEGKVYSEISQVIGNLMPTYLEEPNYDERFLDAVLVASIVLKAEVRQSYARVRAEAVLREARRELDGKVIVLYQPIPWRDLEIDPEVLYMVYPAPDGSWKLQQVHVAIGEYEGRKPLPKPWGGLTGVDLDKVTGIQDCTFCHNNWFVTGNLTLEGVLEMAQIAVEY